MAVCVTKETRYKESMSGASQQRKSEGAGAGIACGASLFLIGDGFELIFPEVNPDISVIIFQSAQGRHGISIIRNSGFRETGNESGIS